MRLFLPIVCLFLSVSGSSERDMTISVEPGTQECFFVTVQAGKVLDVEYQVIDAGQGELDIDFRIFSPSRRLIIAETRKSDGSHRLSMDESGDCEFCFDNKFSIYSAKSVFFEIAEDDGEEVSDELWGDEDLLGDLQPEEAYEIQIKEIQDSVYRVRDNLDRAEKYQNELRAIEARDRNVAEASFTRVNMWSLGHLFVMVLSGVLQVVMVRSLFDEQSRVHLLWKKLGG